MTEEHKPKIDSRTGGRGRPIGPARSAFPFRKLLGGLVLAAALAAGAYFLGAFMGMATPASEPSIRVAVDFAPGPEARAAEFAPKPEARAADPVVVGMTDRLSFEPERVTIRVGQTVRWENTTPIPHTVTADPSRARNPDNVRLPDGADPFDSGDMGAGDTFEHTFTVPGEYRYFCVPHEAAAMVGTIVVQP